MSKYWEDRAAEAEAAGKRRELMEARRSELTIANRRYVRVAEACIFADFRGLVGVVDAAPGGDLFQVRAGYSGPYVTVAAPGMRLLTVPADLTTVATKDEYDAAVRSDRCSAKREREAE